MVTSSLLLLTNMNTATVQLHNYPNISPPYLANWTATALYDAATELCCQGIVYGGGLLTYRRCCGSSIFDQATQVCCNGEVLSASSDGKPRLCCGSKSLFDPQQELCCFTSNDDATVYERQSWSDACCGKARYNIATDFCCANATMANIYPRPPRSPAMCCGAEAFNPTTHVCCGKQAYEANSTACCSDAPVSKDKFAACCDTYAAPAPDGTPRLCCGHRIHDNRDHALGCCGSEPFDQREALCCSGSKGPQVVKVDEGSANSKACCGERAFDPRTEGCCSDGIESNVFSAANASSAPFIRCCGAKSFDTRTDICCGRTMHQRDKQSVYCCGEDAFYPTSGLACCGGLASFDINTQVCCGVSVLPAPNASASKRTCCFDHATNDGTPWRPRF